MNNLHRRRMQENPYPPITDYVRVVSKSDELSIACATESGRVWVTYVENNKRVFKRLSCIKGKILTNSPACIAVPAKEALFLGTNELTNNSSYALDVYDASKSKTMVRIDGRDAYKSIANSPAMSLIDVSNSDINPLKFNGYGFNTIGYGWDYSKCACTKIYNCKNATELYLNGVDSNSELHGLYTCNNLELIKIYSSQIFDNEENVISVFDGTLFPKLKTLELRGVPVADLNIIQNSIIKLLCNTGNINNTTKNLPTSLEDIEFYTTSTLDSSDFSRFINLKRLVLNECTFGDNVLILPESITTFSCSFCSIKSADLSMHTNLTSFACISNSWGIGELYLPSSVQAITFGRSWGSQKYPMPDLTACTNLTSINCQRCTNIPNLDQQAFIDSLPTFTDGSTHTINLKNTGVVADTVAALEAKGWTVQV